jgi:tetratricopeptide (TPR) repeat protein
MTNQSTDFTRLIETARTHWHTSYALLIAEILFLGLATPILVVLNPSFTSKLITYLLGCTITSIIWWYTNRLPKTKRGKLGFVISISTGDERERKKIREDFVITLHELLRGGATGESFQLIEIPEHIAEKIIDIENARALRVKCRAHFLIFGRVRLREIGGKQKHVLNLEGMVGHIPLSDNIRAELSKEFRELFPRRVRISIENDIISFAFTSDWINCVSRYIIGIAAAVSGDLYYAEKLYNDVAGLLKYRDHSFPVYAILKQRIPIRLGEIYFTRANLAYEDWIKSHDPTKIDEMGNYLEKIPMPMLNDYNVINLRSILLFLHDRNIKEAINTLRRCKRASDGTWLYNMGFLYAYMGNLRKAIQCYNNASRLSLQPDVIAKIEEFMVWILEQEPTKYQIYYCLGYINWKEKGDIVQALKDFQAFLSSGQETEFVKEREFAQKWMNEIKSSNIV